VRVVPLVRVTAAADDLRGVLARAGVEAGRPVVVVVGGAGGMSGAAAAAFETVLRDAVVPVVERVDAAVVDGGTDSGVMRSTGRVRAGSGARFPLIGVAVAATVAGGAEHVVDDAADLEPNHSLAVLVPGATWGDEVEWISGVASALAGDRPALTILVNGGDIAYADVATSHAHRRPVLVLAGTGRTADAIADARAGRQADPRAVASAGSDLTLVAPVDDVDAVRAALDGVLSRPR
jgi:hypothetical protein